MLHRPSATVHTRLGPADESGHPDQRRNCDRSSNQAGGSLAPIGRPSQQIIASLPAFNPSFASLSPRATPPAPSSNAREAQNRRLVNSSSASRVHPSLLTSRRAASRPSALHVTKHTASHRSRTRTYYCLRAAASSSPESRFLVFFAPRQSPLAARRILTAGPDPRKY